MEKRSRGNQILKCIDIHCHILPGVDDGADTLETSLVMLKMAEAEGITDMILTPHYQSGRFFTPSAEIRKRMKDLKAAMEQEGIDIRLYFGTEIYYRSNLEEKLESGQLASMNRTNRILVEFSPTEEYSYIRNAMEDLMGMGYIPILAHVERFACMLKDMEHVRYLRKLGCEIQANAGSITGAAGWKVKRYLDRLLKEELVDYLGTDAHNMMRRKPEMQKCAELLYRKYREEYVRALLYENAEEKLLKAEATGEWQSA